MRADTNDASQTREAPKLSKVVRNKLDKLPSTSAKIRYLDGEGYTRTEITELLGKRYQHVRNVLLMPLTSEGGETQKH